MNDGKPTETAIKQWVRITNESHKLHICAGAPPNEPRVPTNTTKLVHLRHHPRLPGLRQQLPDRAHVSACVMCVWEGHVCDCVSVICEYGCFHERGCVCCLCARSCSLAKKKQSAPAETVCFITCLAAATSPPTTKAEVAAFTTRSTA